MQRPASRFRLIVVGAGFSRPAGLPLGADLLRLVVNRSRTFAGADNPLLADLRRFAAYKNRADGWDGTDPLALDLEEFVAFLDVEHFLGFRGSDTLSREGNPGQLLIRQLIAQVIYENTPASPPDLYLSFAKRLLASDIILTLNYDLLIERALDAVGKPYRLFPDRLADADRGIVDSSREEVVILKVHGSIDWFDITDHERLRDSFRAQAYQGEPKHPIFSRPERYQARPLVDGPYFAGSPLTRIYRIGDVDAYYGRPVMRAVAPLLISPSFTKLVYAEPFRDFWWGLGKAGWLNLDLGIIGCSLAPYDAYVRQGMYEVVDNFQNAEPDLELGGQRKSRLKVVTRCQETSELELLKARYGFVDWSRTELYQGGFDETAVSVMFGGP
jgi:SIR2-like domain